MKHRQYWTIVLVIMLCFVTSPAGAVETHQGQIADLDELLESVRQQQLDQRELNEQREREFLADKEGQQARLDQARKVFEQSQSKNQPLLKSTQANENEILRLEKQLEDQLQSMGDIASTFREFSGDFAAVISESMVTAQIPGRSEKMYQLGTIEAHPTIEQIQTLWLLLQEEMTESSRIAKFDAGVVATDGSVSRLPVVRIGTFSVLYEAGFLRYAAGTGELLVLNRQPAARYRTAAANFVESKANLATVVIDPTRGGLLGMMGYTPDLRERIDQGGPIARIILSLGALGVFLTLWRTISLSGVYLRVRRQIRDFDQPRKSNPLGRIMLAAADAPSETDDLLLLKIDEAILAEIPALERGTGLIKLLAATAPLLGLLGTVTGMIVTFQSISLFGTGDPKLMAGGISQALVTTVLGLVVAIPLLFGHNLVASLSRSLVQRLDEQSAGMLARTMEKQERP